MASAEGGPYYWVGSSAWHDISPLQRVWFPTEDAAREAGYERSDDGFEGLEDFEILGELGRGGTSIVYHARDRALGREVAIKVMHAVFGEEESLARFAQEARLLASLRHPNIVSAFAIKQLKGGGLALVMEYVPGETLRDVISQQAPLPVPRAEAILKDIGGALVAAHRHGVVHRDVKPDNVFLEADTGRPLLADFGIAVHLDNPSGLTIAGSAVGTPNYMSPEQIDGHRVDGRSDLYSLGLIGWEMLTGEKPWAGESLYSVIYKQKHDQLPSIRNYRADVPDHVIDAIEGTLAKDPAERWAGVEEFLARLSGGTVARRRNGAWDPGVWGAGRSAARRGGPSPDEAKTVYFRREVTRSASSPALEGFKADLGLPVRKQVAAVVQPPVEEALPAPAPAPVPAPAPQPVEDRRAVRIWLRSAAVAAGVVLALIALDPQVEPLVTSDTAGEVIGEIGPAVDRMVDAVGSAISGAAAAPDDPDSFSPLVGAAELMPGAADPYGPMETGPEPFPGASATTAGLADEFPPETSEGSPPVEAEEPAAETRQTAAAEDPPDEENAAADESEAFPDGPVIPVTRSTSQLATGGMHSCELDVSGSLYCWGGNEGGQLGTGDRRRSSSPVPVPSTTRLRAVMAGGFHTCALDTEGIALCWGENGDGQIGAPVAQAAEPVRVSETRFASLALGMAHTCGLSNDGQVYCWGSNDYGQLGDGTRTSPEAPIRVPLRDLIANITAGWNHTCALTRQGRVLCWGQNQGGQLGDGTTTNRPTAVYVRSTVPFRSLSAGSAHTCGLTQGGEAYCWGQNSDGRIGDGTTVNRMEPVPVLTSQRFVGISAGGRHTCGITVSGAAYCWGQNTYGQLGNGNTVDQPVPVRVQSDIGFVSIRSSGAHTCAIGTDGATYCWGYNIEGQVGDGTQTHRSTPRRVERPSRVSS